MRYQARFRDVFAIAEFRALWAGELLSVLGDQLARVVVAVLVFQQTASAGWTALTYVLTFAPTLLGGALLGGLADRLPRRELLIGLNLLRALPAGLMAIPELPLPVLLCLLFLVSFAGGPVSAARQALLPSVLSGDRYAPGLAVRAVGNQAAQAVGFLGGGAVLTVVAPAAAFGVNALTLILAALVVALGVGHRPAAGAADGRSGGPRSTVRLIRRDRALRGLVLVSWLVGCYAVTEGLAAPYVGVGAPAAAVGLLMAAGPLGGVVGAALARWLPRRFGQPIIASLAIAAGLPLVASLTRPGLAVTVVLWALSGALSTACLLLAQAAFLRRVPDHHRGAATGLIGTGVLFAQGAAIVGAGLLADATSPAIAVAVAAAAGVVLAGLVGGSWLRARHHAPEDPERQPSGRVADDVADKEVTSPCSPSSSAPPPVETAAEHGIGGANPAIIARSEGAPAAQRSRLPWRWAIWQIPRHVLVCVVSVELLAVGLTWHLGRPVAVGPDDLAGFGVIAGLGVTMGELSRHVERVRRRFSDTPHVNLTSVWTFSSALLLPPHLTAAVVVVLYQHLFWRSWYRVRGVHAYRLVFTASTVVLAAEAAWAIRHALVPGGLSTWGSMSAVAGIALAVLAYAAVNSGLIALAITLFERRIDVRRAVGTGRENALEFGTLGLGAVTTALLMVHPAWALMIMPALLVLHRSVLMRQLEEAASTDQKTGLANATAWTNLASTELLRAAREGGRLGVLMVDLDHFKAVNDRYGHVAGDRVLHAVAEAMTMTVRRYDVVGRWGGEEFAVLCPDITTEGLTQLGERIRRRVRELAIPVGLSQGDAPADKVTSLTVSIGAATYPEFGPELRDVLLAADDALFVAKDRGRDQVRSIITEFDGVSADPTATRP